MKSPSVKPVRCAIYTRVSTDQGLDQEFNSLDAQYDAASAYIKSQAHAGWTLIRSRYDDGGYSGGSTDRPDLQRLLDDIRSRKLDVIVVYKVDRLTRSLADFAKLVELFDAHGVSFVSVTQQFNTTTSMGRLTLNVLLSFAQFEREVTSERIRDKIAASKRKGLWVETHMSTDTVEEHRAASPVDQPTTSAAALTAMGIVYGDLGTSPLYTLQAVAQTFDGGLSPSAALGSLSLIFWLLIITVSIKYCLFVMRADNHGEGGILALMLLTRASWHGRGRALVIMGLFGAALIYGDGIITPAISVLSALEGLNH